MSRILVIDDEEPVRLLLRKMLEQAGHEVDVASGGSSGIELYRQRGADIVITDILMPGMDGIETIRQLRRESPGVRILAISGGGRIGADHYLCLAGKLGALSELSKPFSRQSLIDEVDTLLASAGS